MTSLEETLAEIVRLANEGTGENLAESLDQLLVNLVKLSQEDGSILNDSQAQQLFEAAIELTWRGYPDILDEKFSTNQLMTLLLIDRFGWAPEFELPDNLEGYPHISPFIEMYRRLVQRFLPPGEDILHEEIGQVLIGDGSRFRGGGIFVTRDRLIFTDRERFDKRRGDKLYISYPDMKEHPYYLSIDYLPLDQMSYSKVNFGWMRKNLLLAFDDIQYYRATKKLVTDKRSTFSAGETLELEKGQLPIKILLMKFDNEPKAHYRSRYEILQEVCNSQSSLLSK